MKKSDLKATLKPVVLEILKEALMEEPGFLGHIIAETLKAQGSIISEIPQRVPGKAPTIKEFIEKAKRPVSIERVAQELREQKQQLIEGAKRSPLGKGSENILAVAFEGTAPLGTDGSEKSSIANPLGGTDPDDPGVDLSRFGF